jgi:thioredoxin reductase (NADPH)
VGRRQIRYAEGSSNNPPIAPLTRQPGVFAVGDVRSGSAKQVATAVSEGAMAIRLASQRMQSG